MSASLVGSEMCIRDSPDAVGKGRCGAAPIHSTGTVEGTTAPLPGKCRSCLLYTSDAADDM
eukprot:6758250-Alexandrium_andersonii.AAC.1